MESLKVRRRGQFDILDKNSILQYEWRERKNHRFCLLNSLQRRCNRRSQSLIRDGLRLISRVHRDDINVSGRINDLLDQYYLELIKGKFVN